MEEEIRKAAEERKGRQKQRWHESLKRRPGEAMKVINDKWKEQEAILWVDRRDGTQAVGKEEVKEEVVKAWEEGVFKKGAKGTEEEKKTF